jgi:hypothetical protein
MKGRECKRISCVKCPLYLPNYAVADPADCVLIQTTAALDYQHTQHWKRSGLIGTWLYIMYMDIKGVFEDDPETYEYISKILDLRARGQ